jgi:hypothetical protein
VEGYNREDIPSPVLVLIIRAYGDAAGTHTVVASSVIETVITAAIACMAECVIASIASC